MAARSYNYDSLSRLLCASNPETSSATCPPVATGAYILGTTGYSYDANGNVISKTSPAPNQTGTATVVTAFAYDALNRILSKSYNDAKTPTASFLYDSVSSFPSLTNTVGRLVEASGGAGIATYSEYDSMGRISGQFQYTPNSGNNSHPFAYTYDYLGDMLSASDGYFHTYTYAYNTAARLTTISGPGTPATLISGIHYNAAGQITSDTLGTAEAEVYTYTKKNQVLTETAVLNSTATYSYNLTYAPNGDVITGVDSVNGTWSYGYDQFNRLVCSNLAANGTCASPTSGVPTYSYIYDRFGNRWQQNGPRTMLATFTGNNHGNNNRLDGYAYDSAGNLLNDGVNYYTYDAENRVVQVQQGGSTGAVVATYQYDANGNRVSRTGVTSDTCDGTGKRDYSYDLAGHMALETNAGGTECRTEIYAGARHIVTNANGNASFDHSDWLGMSAVAIHTPAQHHSSPARACLSATD